MNLYKSIFKLKFRQGLQYRTAAIAGILTQIFFGLIFLCIYTSFYGEADAIGDFTKGHLVTYLWLQQAFLTLIVLWLRDNELFDLITTGNIAYELCRPINVYKFWFSKLIATRVSLVLLRCLPILVFAMLIPKPYGLALPNSFPHFIFFVVTLFLAGCLNVAISMLIYISVFVTLSPVGSLLLFSVFGEFFAGQIIPVPLMPQWLKTICYCLPFRYVGDLPFRVYSGNLSIMSSVMGVIMQLLWLAAMLMLGDHLMKRSLNKLVVQGG